MKVLHICETAIGGVATYLQILHDYAPDGVHNVFVVPSNHVDDLDAAMDIITFPSEKRGPEAMWNMIKTARKSVRTTAPDIVFFHSTFSLGALTFLRASGWRGKAIYCAHGWAVCRGNSDTSFKTRVVRVLERYVPSQANAIVNISQFDQSIAQKNAYKGNHICIENAVRDTLSVVSVGSAASADISLLFVGRLDHQKGIDVLLEAFGAVTEKRTDISLTVVGEAVRGDPFDAADYDKVRFVGWVSPNELDALYADADALIVPSRWEGFGLVVPEALRNGTPILVSDSGALPGFVATGKNGYVFALDPKSIEVLLLSLTKNDLQGMRGACREMFETRHTISRWRSELNALYSNLTQGKEM